MMPFRVPWRTGPGGRKAVGPPPFSPLDIAGLQLWLDFSDATKLFTDAGTTPVSADADLIYQANDKSGNDRHAVQATSASRPAYKVNIKNGRSVSRHDGSNDCLVSTFGATLSQPNTIIAAVFVPNENTAYHSLYDGIASGSRHAANQNRAADAQGFALYAGSNPQLDVSLNQWSILSVIWDTTASKLWENGSAVGATYSVGTHSLTGLTVGGKYSVSEAWNGDFAELLVYAGALSDENRGLIETYLNTKWAVY